MRQTAPPAGLATPLQYVKGVGPQRAKLLAKKDLETVEDALFFLPLRHEDVTEAAAAGADRMATLVEGILARLPPKEEA